MCVHKIASIPTDWRTDGRTDRQAGRQADRPTESRIPPPLQLVVRDGGYNKTNEEGNNWFSLDSYAILYLQRTIRLFQLELHPCLHFCIS